MRSRIILFTFVMFAVLSSAFSQTSGSVAINISLHPIQILKINPTQSEVLISYENEEDYQQGVVSVQENHLTVFSTSGFEVSVFSSALPEIETQGREVQLTPIQIGVQAPESASGAINVGNIQLQHFKQNIISSNRQDFGISFDIEYQGLGENIYLEHQSKNMQPSVLSTKVIYSIEVK